MASALAARNFLSHPLGALPAEGPGSEGVRRRSSVLVGFIGGIVLLKERRNIGWKSASLALMLAGVIVLNWTSR